MFCKNCGAEMMEGSNFCLNCGFAAGDGKNFCQNCGSAVNPEAAICLSCGAELKKTPAAAQKSSRSKLAAGLLGLFLGGFGIHNFYLGYTGKAIGQIVLTLCTCGIGEIWGFIEGILILTGSIDKDADGNPLKD